MSVPVTTRLDAITVAALDQAVASGLAPNRGAIVSAAVADWLAHHGEAAIVASYRARYKAPDAAQDDLVAKLAAFSVAACLAVHES